MSEKGDEGQRNTLCEGEQAAAGFCYLCQQIKDADVIALQLLSLPEQEILRKGDALLGSKYAQLGLNQEITPMEFRAQIFDDIAAQVQGYREVVLKHTGNVMALIDKALSE